VKLDGGGAYVWSKQIADSSYGDQEIDGVAFDGLGNVIATGRARGDIDFGAGVVTSHGGYDLVLAKYAADGALVWGDLFGDTSDGQQGTFVRGDPTGNVYVTGRLTGVLQFPQGPILAAYGNADVFVAKLEPDGTTTWAQHFGGFPTDSLGQSLALDDFGNVLLCGTTSANSLLFGGQAAPLPNKGQSDGYLAKLDSTGTALWAKTLGGSSGDRCWGVAARKGRITVTGEFSGTVSIDASILTSAGYTDIFTASVAP
jgi:hypothetical protein